MDRGLKRSNSIEDAGKEEAGQDRNAIDLVETHFICFQFLINFQGKKNKERKTNEDEAEVISKESDSRQEGTNLCDKLIEMSYGWPTPNP